MRQPERVYEAMHDVHSNLRAIDKEEEARKTIIDGEAFNNEEWLDAEFRELKNERKRLTKTVTTDGTFAGLEA